MNINSILHAVLHERVFVLPDSGLLVMLAVLLCAPAVRAEHSQADPAALKNWQDLRFGMFIHWGPVSLTGHEIGWSRGKPTPIAEYDQLYTRFNPTNFDANAWALTAKAAGMKYMVLTTKHHDGFCLWDTKATDYNIMQTPFGRDVVKELAEACRRHDIRFGTYYSVTDWYHPDFPLGSPAGKTKHPNPNLDGYTEFLEQQVKELITGYGPLLTMWFDVPATFDNARGSRVVDFVRGLQPDIVINNRTGAPGDYDTPEQRIGGFNVSRPWETCMTICRQWAWKPNDGMKSLAQCLQTLVMTAGGDGNLLFNVGPMPDGRIEPRQVERLEEMGRWLERNGESIYGTRGGPYKPAKDFVSTRNGERIYLHLLNGKREVVLPVLPVGIRKAELLGGGEISLTTDPDGTQRIALSGEATDPIDAIVVLTMAGDTMKLEPVSLDAD